VFPDTIKILISTWPVHWHYSPSPILLTHTSIHIYRALEQGNKRCKIEHLAILTHVNFLSHFIYFCSCQFHSCQSAVETFQILQHLLSNDWFLSILMNPKRSRFFNQNSFQCFSHLIKCNPSKSIPFSSCLPYS
jgi:hypothetical protein